MLNKYQVVFGEFPLSELAEQDDDDKYTYESEMTLLPGMIVTVPVRHGGSRTATVVQAGSRYTGECRQVSAVVAHAARPLCTAHEQLKVMGGFAIYKLTFSDQSTVVLPVPANYSAHEFLRRPLARIVEKISAATDELQLGASFAQGVVAERKNALLSMALQYTTVNLDDALEAYAVEDDEGYAGLRDLQIDGVIISPPTEDEMTALRSQLIGT